MALAWAPAGVSQNSHPFLPTTNGRILFSLSYSNMKITEWTSHQRFLYREEELAGHWYDQWSQIFRYHLQCCRDSKSKQFKTIWVFRISVIRHTGTYGRYRYKFSGKSTSLVGNPSWKHKKTKPVNFDAATLAACVNGVRAIGRLPQKNNIS